MEKIKVLVVDDSAFMRKVITDILTSDNDIDVVATARNGKEAIEKTRTFKPDVVTMDIDMPEMDGITALKEIMRSTPVPVVMISAHTYEGAKQTIEALECGAVNFIPKTDGQISFKMKSLKSEMLARVREAAKTNMKSLNSNMRKYSKKPAQEKIQKKFHTGKIVVIGASTGGPQALEAVLTKLPKGFPAPILVVQHMPPNFTKLLADRLSSISSIEIREAKDGDLIQEGLALFAPGGYHMELKNARINGEYIEMVRLNQKPEMHGVRPCVDMLMTSVAPIYGKNTIGVLLTGMGCDGTEGMKEIKQGGGTTIAEDEKTCIIYGMPKSAIDARVVDYVVPLQEIPRKIVECL